MKLLLDLRRRLKSIDSKKFDNRIPMSKNTNAEDDSCKDQQIPKYIGREKKFEIPNGTTMKKMIII